ncbi:MAG: ABC transporter permease, partial [Bacteroidales bacterium]|nr:ABC transporter permease [Bacteroidales bacterium]
LMSKVVYLLLLSALQMALFVLVANPVLGIKGMTLTYWTALFITAFCANMLGLNISASFNSAITIYIVIPILIIPMMVLSGAMFPFDKLNRTIGNVDKVPLIAELMPTRWTYEALMVSQFKDNRYSSVAYNRNGETYYMLQKTISEAEFNKVHRLKVLREALATTLFEYRSSPGYLGDDNSPVLKRPVINFSRLDLLRNEISSMPRFGVPAFSLTGELTPSGFNPATADSLFIYLTALERHFSRVSNSASDRRDSFHNLNENRLRELEKDYYNYKLLEIVTKPYERNKFIIYRNTIVQNTDPVFLEPSNSGFFGFRTHFYSPAKYLAGLRIDTFAFNMCITALSAVLLYLALYYNVLRRLVSFHERLRFRK